MDTPPPVPPPFPTPPPPPNVAAAPVKKANRTVIIVLCSVLGVFLLIGGCVASCTYIVGKKAKQYSAEAKNNPQMATVTLAATLAPDVEIVSKDETANLITLHNKKTGELIKLDLNDYSADNVVKAVQQFSKGVKVTPSSSSAAEHNGASRDDTAERTRRNTSSSDESSVSPARAVAMAEVLKKFPSFVPSYPGATTDQATLTSRPGSTSGNYGFTTADKPERVVEYYEKEATSAGFIVASRSSETNDHGPTAQLIVTRVDPACSVSVTAEAAERGNHVTVNFTHP